MVTADRRGRFYTVDPAEAATAQREHGFVPTDEAAGITLLDRPVEGAVAVHRLRLREGHQAYLLSTDPREIERVRGQFDDEGVVGYVYARPGDGRMELTRYSRDGDWRVARADRADLPRAGFHVDGPLGYVPRG
ncbi:hypothetical protein BJF78_30825 [Pseudonocardia sp. CNS-139]|nr:hypothetical protein BJF78_30825 [Pseudonocardia sp. CNS-139]